MVQRNWVYAYGVSLVVLLVAILVRIFLEPVLEDRLPFITLFLAIPFAAWYGGRGPALVCLFIGALAVSFFLSEPRWSFPFHKPDYTLGLGLYGFVGLASIAMFDSLDKVRQRLENEKRQLKRELAARQSAEQVLANREGLLRVTFASIGDGVITTDADGRITYLNSVAEQLTGWKSEEAEGLLLSEVFQIISEETRLPVESPVTKALREGNVVGLANHTILISRNGSELAIDDSAAPIRDNNQRCIGCVMVFHDVTEQRKLEREISARLVDARLLSSIVESSDDAIVSKTLDGIIQSWNTAAERMFGYSAEEAVGKHITLIIPPDRTHEEELIIGRLRKGERIDHYETIRSRKNRELFPVSLTVSPLRDETGRIVGASKIARDISHRTQLEKELSLSMERFRLAIDAGAAMIYDLDLTGKREPISHGLERITGYPLTDTNRSSKWWHSIIHPEDRPLHFANHEQHKLQGGTSRDSYRIQRPDGTWMWVEDTAQVVNDEQGRAVQLVGAIVDITERKESELRLQASEERFRILADTVPSMVWTANREGDITYANSNWFKYCGLIAGSGKWQWPELPIHPEDYHRCVNAWKASLMDGTDYQVEIRLRRKDGVYCWFMTQAVPLKDNQGAVLAWFGVTTNINDLKELQEQLRSADRRKDEFLATLAHELRNPLAPVKNSLELMKLAGSDPARMESSLTIMERQIVHMIRLIDDLMDVNRITRNKLVLKKEIILVKDIMEHALEICRPLIERFGHKLEIACPEEPLFLNADMTRLSQVFGNLLSNACKYTRPGGRIEFKAWRDQQIVVMEVKDNGVGIPPEMLPHVFELFTQVDQSLERSQGGLGIGLSLVKRLVEMHGGSVEGRSAGLGKGSEFIVKLPKAEPPSNVTDVASSKVNERNECFRILVVDDNQDSAFSMAELLQLHGHKTFTAHDGQAAVEKASQEQPDVILMDLGLPRMNGYDACQIIRQQQGEKRTLIIALTGWGQEEDRKRSREVGFDVHLVKPVDSEVLLAHLKKYGMSTEIKS